MSEVDPDPHEPAGEQRTSGDPTDGGRHGEIGSAPSVASDEPDAAGPGYPVGGGDASEEPDAVPVADPGRDA